MQGSIKAINNVYPITVLDAVKLGDGTNKSLKDIIEDGSLGYSGVTAPSISDTATASGSTWSSQKIKSYIGSNIKDAYIRGGIVNFKIYMYDKTVTISPRTDGTTMDKQIYVHFFNNTVETPALKEFTLSNCEFLKWNKDNGFVKGSNNYGFAIAENEVLIAVNHNGVIDGGILKDLFNREVTLSIKNYYEPTYYEKKQLAGALHCCTSVDGCLWTIDKPDDGGMLYMYDSNFNVTKNIRTSFIEDDEHTVGMICCDYNQNNKCLVIGNGDGFATTGIMRAYIFYDCLNWKNVSDNILTFDNCGEYTMLDFRNSNLFPNDYKCHVIWGQQNEDRNDIVYLITTNRQKIYKLQLGKGAEKMEYGTYTETTSDKYNGTYRILDKWQQTISGTANKDSQYYNGVIYSSIKGVTGCCVHKQVLKSNGTIEIEQIRINPIDSSGKSILTSAPEGLVIMNGKIGCTVARSTYLYVFDII